MIALEQVWLAYGGRTVLRDCCLRLEKGERAALSGPSGCGKTSLLRVAAGLEHPSKGRTLCEGRISYAFQEPRLFPWLTAEENLALVLPSGGGHPGKGRDGIGRNALDWLSLAGLRAEAKKYPPALSGGMRQRLNLLRALAWGGENLLLDEPFRGLDPVLRRDMAALILEEAPEAERTLLLVTHDPEEADLLRISRRYILRDGAPQTVC